MQSVRVKASKEYDVVIGKDLLSHTGKLSSEVITPCKAVVVTDSTVDGLYSEKVIKSLEDAGFKIDKFVFKAGEASKNTDTLIKMLDFFAKSNLTRSDAVFALGGGVCGDIAGFAASCFLRGIQFVQIPTTFLAAIDSSVGGKTAVNLVAGKNLMGAFYQPSLVICDTLTFDTLSEGVFADGIAEAIKYGAVFDRSLFDDLSGDKDLWNLEDIVRRCVEIKAEIVGCDEHDKGVRQLLNFGHTVGHAIEKKSGYSITHGHAVAIGMVIASAATDETSANQIADVCKKHNLPVKCSFSAHELTSVALSDKKRTGDNITLVIPKEIGNCVLEKIPVSELCDFIEKGLSYDC